MSDPDRPLALVLASGSPRRRELLERLSLRFTVLPADVDESPRPGETARTYVARVAREKAAVGARAHPRALVLAADTSVVLDGELLGKPRDRAEALSMLERLCGRTHQVLTAIAVAGPCQDGEVVATEVDFRPASAEELRWYVATGEPMDKAGAYGLQGAGGFLVSSIRGSHSNVIGLPLAETLALLARAGLALPWSARR